MANKIVVFALFFFAAVGMAASDPSADLSSSPAAAALAAAVSAQSPAAVAAAAQSPAADNVIGTISGGGPSDAAPIGGPVPEGAFADATAAAPAPNSGAVAMEATTVAGAVAAAGVVGSFFFF